MAVPTQSKSRVDGELANGSNEINERIQEPRFGYTNVGDSTVRASRLNIFLIQNLSKIYYYASNAMSILEFVATVVFDES